MVEEALTDLGILDGVDIDLAALRQTTDRNEILALLKDAGVPKLGQRMKLLSLVQAEQANPSLAPKPASSPPLPSRPDPQPQVEHPPAQLGAEPQHDLQPSADAAPPQRHGLRGPVPSPSNIPGLTPTNLGRLGSAGWFEVVPKAVKVRSSPSIRSDDNVIAFKKQRQVFEAELEQDGWVRLKERAEPGGGEQWVLIDGTVLGLGALLKRVPPSARLRDEEDERLEARVSDLAVENWADEM